jgi:succinate dehydrogenase / fumarate reductase iron-sulfur subunit
VKLTLKVWRQKNAKATGAFEDIVAYDISPDMSFLEMLDLVNERLIAEGKEAIAFDHDCREGICGACSLTINGTPHGPQEGTTTCQLHMRHFRDGDDVIIEPWRAKAFPVIKDLITDRSSFDRIIQAGGFVSVNCGGTQDANAIPISKTQSDLAMDAAACIGCGACAAACKNASAMLFVSAKVSHLARLPQGQLEKSRRVLGMLTQMEDEGFGGCTNTLECEAVCPKSISVSNIAFLNREYMKAAFLENSP